MTNLKNFLKENSYLYILIYMFVLYLSIFTNNYVRILLIVLVSLYLLYLDLTSIN